MEKKIFLTIFAAAADSVSAWTSTHRAVIHSPMATAIEIPTILLAAIVVALAATIIIVGAHVGNRIWSDGATVLLTTCGKEYTSSHGYTSSFGGIMVLARRFLFSFLKSN